MKKTLVIATSFILIAALCFVILIFEKRSNESRDAVKTVITEDQAYGAMKSCFKYYYSMDLYGFSKILEDVDSLKPEDEIQKSYLLGCIDSYLSYNPYYLHATKLFDQYISNKILPSGFADEMGTFNEAKIQYLTNIKQALNNSSDVIYTDSFKKSCREILSILNTLNCEANDLKELDYSTSFDKVEMEMNSTQFE